ncbi:MAG TPA: hypothetical protein VHY08_12570 [Bacillota bacterium]|nr:hypothetical protein [Bacillota bacterium]
MKTNRQKPKNIRIAEKKAYIKGRELTAKEQQDKDVKYQTGELGPPFVHDKRLEMPLVRKGLRGEDGEICLGVHAGDELGDISIAIQFEGPMDTGNGEPDLCMKGQNALLLQASEWLSDIFGQFGVEFEGVIEAEPCPKATTTLVIQEAAQILELGKVDVISEKLVGVDVKVQQQTTIEPSKDK